jgi:hypothetical protein
VFRILLDHITHLAPSAIANWATAKAVLALGERYQCHHIPRLVSQSLQPCIRSNPSGLFVFASQHDFESLAKAAIQVLGKDNRWSNARVESLSGEALEGASSKYVVALVRSMGESERVVGRNDWARVAQNFKIAS